MTDENFALGKQYENYKEIALANKYRHYTKNEVFH